MVEKETIVRRLTFLEEYCSDLDEARHNINWENYSQDKVVRRYVCFCQAKSVPPSSTIYNVPSWILS
jgi:hypothetical protein